MLTLEDGPFHSHPTATRASTTRDRKTQGASRMYLSLTVVGTLGISIIRLQAVPVLDAQGYVKDGPLDGGYRHETGAGRGSQGHTNGGKGKGIFFVDKGRGP